jgi:hypothetical protein
MSDLPAAEVVLVVQVLQQLAIHAVLNGVHHLRFRESGTM